MPALIVVMPGGSNIIIAMTDMKIICDTKQTVWQLYAN